MTTRGPAVRAAIDVGGTFTDLVYFYADPATDRQEVVTTPRPRTSNAA